jgi:hypothetical protein
VSRGAPKGNQNAAKEGRTAFLHIRTSSEFKGALNAAAPGGMTDFIHEALREYMREHHPDVVERFPEAFRD